MSEEHYVLLVAKPSLQLCIHLFCITKNHLVLTPLSVSVTLRFLLFRVRRNKQHLIFLNLLHTSSASIDAISSGRTLFFLRLHTPCLLYLLPHLMSTQVVPSLCDCEHMEHRSRGVPHRSGFQFFWIYPSKAFLGHIVVLCLVLHGTSILFTTSSYSRALFPC